MKTTPMNRKIVVEIISYEFIVLFVYAAVSKVIDFKRFNVQIGKTELLADVAPIVAWSIPALEIAVSLLLVFPRMRVVGLYGSFSLMLMFTVYIIVVLTLSSDIPCSCGGVLEKLGWTEHLVFNIVFTLLALAAILMESRRSRIENVQVSNVDNQI
jgi:hypothetical protein